MSIIAFKIFENKIQVAADGRVTSGDSIVKEDSKKIKKISDSLIIGQTGLDDTNEIYERFILANQEPFENLTNVTDGLIMFKAFKNYLETIGYTKGDLRELGDFLIVNKNFACVFRYTESLSPYSCLSSSDGATSGAFGSCGEYTTALIDCGIELEDAIKRSAKKYTSINDNVTILEINR